MRASQVLGVVAILAAAALRAAAGDIAMTVAGKYYGSARAYDVGPDSYLSAKDLMSAYGGQLSWYPMAGRVRLSVRGKPMDMWADSAVAALPDAKIKLPAPMIVRASQAFVPLAFIVSQDFAKWSGMEARYNGRTRHLYVERRSSVASARWFSYGETTRIVIELDKGLGYKAQARGVGGVDISIPLGVLDASEQARLEDGLVDAYTLSQEPGLVRLSVRFAEQAVKWRVKELQEPRRLVLDVFLRQPTIAVAVAASSAAAKPKPAGPVASGVGKAKPTSPVVEPMVVTPLPARPKRRIVIDAGHGGKDPGAVGARGTREKDVNLAAALELARLLRAEEAFDVLLTRSDDVFVPLSDRSRMANEFDADLFVSLHCNANTSRSEAGFEVYFLSENASDPAAERLAAFENSVLALEGKSDDEAVPILEAMAKTESINAASEFAAFVAKVLPKRVDVGNRGVKQAGFYVLRGTLAPAVLVEMAFLTNKKDEANLESPRFLRRMADGLYAGLLEYSKYKGWFSESGVVNR